MFDQTTDHEPKPAVDPEYAAFIDTLDLDTAIDVARTQKELADLAEARKKALTAHIVALMEGMGMVQGQAYIRADKVSATLQKKMTVTISGTKLKGLGVDPDLIEEATTRVPSAMFAVIRIPKKKE